MASIKNLSLVTELNIEGLDKSIKIDFTDKRVTNRLLKLVARYRNIEQEIDAKTAELDSIEDDIDRALAISDLELSILTELKEQINEAFGVDIVGAMFGDTVPGVERYTELFETLMPYIKEAKLAEAKTINRITELYGGERIVGNLAQNS